MDISVALIDTINTYHELNLDQVDELPEEPSPLEFMRYIALNRPFVVRGAIKKWKAFTSWEADYLNKKLESTFVQVAATPDGNADAATKSTQDGEWYFAKPLERKIQFPRFLKFIQRPSTDVDEVDEVWYAQTQNDNMREEYAELFNDVERDMRWASIALGYGPDAVNMWIGNSRSKTAMHRDPYENIFCQLRGSKHFVLISPVEASCVNEQFLRPATWVETPAGLSLQPDDGDEKVPCAVWDPDYPSEYETELSKACRPIRLSLYPGDLLYLPTMWYHKVTQTEGHQGFCCSVNYWYDMQYGGTFFPLDQFMRNESRELSTSLM